MGASVFTPGSTPLADVQGTRKKQKYTLTSGQTVVTLTEFSYAVGTVSLDVYVNGIMQVLGEDYAETSSTSITLTNTSLPAGTEVVLVGFPAITGTVVTGDGKILTSATDGTSAFLTSKLISSNITITEEAGGVGNRLRLTAPASLPISGGTLTGPLTLNDGSEAASLSDVAALLSGIPTGSGPKAAVVVGPVNSSGQPTAVSAVGSNSRRIQLTPGSTGYTLSIPSGPIDTQVTFSAPNTDMVGQLPANGIYHIYYDTATGWGYSEKAPQHNIVYSCGHASLLHFDGANTATTFADAYGRTWTAFGNAQLSTAQFKFGTASLALDGTGDYLTAPHYGMNPDGWTMEGWVRFAVLPTAGNLATAFCALASTASPFGARVFLNNTAGTLKAYIDLSSNGTSLDISAGTLGSKTTWLVNTWYHFALVRNKVKGTYELYVDGVLDITVTSALDICHTDLLMLGSNTANFLNGWIDEFSLEPYAKYKAAFSVPTTTNAISGDVFSKRELRTRTLTGGTENTVAGGGSPVLVNVNRLYVAKVTVGATDVTAVTNNQVGLSLLSVPLTMEGSIFPLGARPELQVGEVAIYNVKSALRIRTELGNTAGNRYAVTWSRADNSGSGNTVESSWCLNDLTYAGTVTHIRSAASTAGVYTADATSVSSLVTGLTVGFNRYISGELDTTTARKFATFRQDGLNATNAFISFASNVSSDTTTAWTNLGRLEFNTVSYAGNLLVRRIV